MKKFVIEILVQAEDDKTCSDVEWGFQDLLFDDSEGNPNFTVGAILGINVDELKNEKTDLIR